LQSFNDYFTVNHGRLLALWRTVVAYRRQFADMKAATERDVMSMRNEVGRLSRTMNSACLNLNANLQNTDLQNQVCFVLRYFTDMSIAFEKLNTSK
jgi:Ciliary rootlet component, centrosome cohesion